MSKYHGDLALGLIEKGLLEIKGQDFSHIAFLALTPKGYEFVRNLFVRRKK